MQDLVKCFETPAPLPFQSDTCLTVQQQQEYYRILQLIRILDFM